MGNTLNMTKKYIIKIITVINYAVDTRNKKKLDFNANIKYI